MKKIIITVALVLVSILSYGQFESTGHRKASGTTFKSFVGSSAVLEKEGTAQQLFDIVRMYILENYKSQEDVIIAETEGQLLKTAGSHGDIKYRLLFKFKNGKMKIQVMGTETWHKGVPSTRYTRYIAPGWMPLIDIKYCNSKGKVFNRGGRIYDSIDNTLNDMLIALSEYETPENEVW